MHLWRKNQHEFLTKASCTKSWQTVVCNSERNGREFGGDPAGSAAGEERCFVGHHHCPERERCLHSLLWRWWVVLWIRRLFDLWRERLAIHDSRKYGLSFPDAQVEGAQCSSSR
nr:uncharacterized protein LOC127305706 isoform X2 [Lolium perenne]